ncbi:MAG: AFG1 family ATPase [Pseudomonadota bacterium]|nr:AFG1 family ATPase [Pseudomonadota bacterium]
MPSKKQASAAPDASLQARYDRQVTAGCIKDDAAQRNVLALLEDLAGGLGQKSLARLFRKPEARRGLYIWGNVGRGKSMLMEMFFEAVPLEKKRRVHFHAFMQEVHARIHRLRQEGRGDPVALLAQQLAQEASLLCFDELQATDVADATLLYRLFSGLFEAEVVVVSTSNHPPANLYTGGVQRERFAKFITLIEEKMQVAALSSPADYRQMQMKSLEQVYFYPLGAAAEAFVAGVIERICASSKPKSDTLAVHGRTTMFSLYDESIGRFTFRELCESALGPADYLALAGRLDTLILTNIPRLSPEKRNEAKRFVTLIDALYEHKVKLIATAAAPPQELYSEGDGTFEFQRTVSRLVEMQSQQYMQK